MTVALETGRPAPRVIAVIQARMGSSRLPGKVLSDIEGRPLLAWAVAAFRAVPSIEDVVVATTVDPADDELAAVAAEYGPVFRGDPADVLSRLAAAAPPTSMRCSTPLKTSRVPRCPCPCLSQTSCRRASRGARLRFNRKSEYC